MSTNISKMVEYILFYVKKINLQDFPRKSVKESGGRYWNIDLFEAPFDLAPFDLAPFDKLRAGRAGRPALLTE